MIITKIKEFFQDKNNKMKVIVVIGLVGILLIMLSEFLPSSSNKEKKEEPSASKSQQTSIVSYKQQTEEDLQSIISKIEGAGQCSVMVTFETSAENVYAYNSSSEFGEKSEKREYNYIIIEDEKNEKPIVVKEIQPKVKGVIIVCEGGDNGKVREAIINSVTSVFGIASNKISINKMANNKER